MADDAETLLLKFGISLEPLKQSFSDIKSLLAGLNNLNDEVLAKSKAALAAQKVVGGELRNQQEAAVVAAQQALAANTQKMAAEKLATEHSKQATKAKKQEVVEAQKGVAVAREGVELKRQEVMAAQALIQSKKLEVAEEQRKTAELRRQIVIAREEAAVQKRQTQAGGTGLLGGFAKDLAGLFGGGLAGSIAGGVLAGGGIAMVIDGLFHGLVGFLDKLKEVTKESSSLALIQDQFQRIAKAAGIDAAAAVHKLQEATGGLVSKAELMKVATTALKSPLGLTMDQITQLAGAFVHLGATTSHTAEQSMEAFNRSMQTGNFRVAARTLGLTHVALVLDNYAQGLGRVSRMQTDSAHGFDVIMKAFKELGEQPKTLEDVLTRFKVTWNDMLADFGKGFQLSPGWQMAASIFERMLGSTDSLNSAATKLGEKMGNLFALIAVGASTAGPVVKNLLKTFEDLLGAVSGIIGGSVAGISGGARQTSGASDTAKASVEKLHPVMSKAVLTILEFNRVLSIATSLIEILLRHTVESPIIKGIVGASGVSALSVLLGPLAAPLAAIHALVSSSDKEKAHRAKLIGDKRLPKDFAGPYTMVPQATYDDPKKMEAARNGFMGQGGRQFVRNTDEEEKALAKKPGLVEEMQAAIAAANAAKGEGEHNYYKTQAEADAAAKLGGAPIQTDKAKQDVLARNQLEEDKLRAATKKQANQLRLAEQAEDIARDKQMNEEAYQSGTKDLEVYLAKKKDLTEADSANKRAKAAQDYDDRMDELNLEQKIEAKETGANEPGPKQLRETKYAEERKQALQKWLSDASSIRKQGAAAEFADDQQGHTLRFNLQKDALTKEEALQKADVAFRQQSNERKYTAGDMSPEEYIANKIAMVKEEAQIEIDAANSIYAIAFLNDKLQATSWQDMQASRVAAQQKATNAITLFQEQEFEILRKNIETTYGGQVGLAKAQTSPIAEGGIGTLAGLQQQQNAIRRQRAQLQALLPGATGEQQTQLNTQIATLTKQFYDLNVEIGRLTDPLVRLSAVLTGLSEIAGQMLKSSFGQNLASEISGGVKSVGTWTSASTQKAIQSGDPGQIIGVLANSLSSFVSALESAKGAIQGAVGGGMSGAGLGGTIGGPLGAAIGAAVGIALGAFIGQKQAQVTANINAANTSFKDIMNTFGQNANNLASALSQITALMAQVQQEQAASKKGSSQYQQLIDQYTQQIISLQNQQIQIIRTMNQQLATLQAPISPEVSTGAQQYLSTLQQILLQYEQFAGAAQSATELANANQFLVQSLQNYEYNMENTLLTDNENAINQALQLNDLIYQRTQLINQLNTQIEGVLTQGVLTRSPTRAQTAGTQIEQIQVQGQMQLAQMNEQISLAQYQVQSAQAVFNLATTRIGLETQLLQLQEAQQSQQMAGIVALQNLVNALSSGSVAYAPLAALLASVPQSTLSPATGTTQTMTQLLEQLFAAAYSNYASLGYGQFGGQNL